MFGECKIIPLVDVEILVKGLKCARIGADNRAYLLLFESDTHSASNSQSLGRKYLSFVRIFNLARILSENFRNIHGKSDWFRTANYAPEAE